MHFIRFKEKKKTSKRKKMTKFWKMKKSNLNRIISKKLFDCNI